MIVNQPVVIDNGSGVIKAGFAGDQVKQKLEKDYDLTIFFPQRCPSVTSQTTLAARSTAELWQELWRAISLLDPRHRNIGGCSVLGERPGFNIE